VRESERESERERVKRGGGGGLTPRSLRVNPKPLTLTSFQTVVSAVVGMPNLAAMAAWASAQPTPTASELVNPIYIYELVNPMYIYIVYIFICVQYVEREKEREGGAESSG